jgi:PII-like signaling protein
VNELNGQQVLVRIYIGESNKYEGKPLYQTIVEMLRREKISGATALRGITGFGARSRLHTANILRLSQDLPVIIEVVDTAENINRILHQIELMIGDGLITMEKVQVIRCGIKKRS